MQQISFTKDNQYRFTHYTRLRVKKQISSFVIRNIFPYPYVYLNFSKDKNRCNFSHYTVSKMKHVFIYVYTFLSHKVYVGQ